MTIRDIHLAQAGSADAIVSGTDRVVKFGGAESVTIPAGQSVMSDPVDFTVEPLADVTVSMYLPQGAEAAPITIHAQADQNVFVAAGDVSGNATIVPVATLQSYYFLTGMDVQNEAAAGAVVAMGASITDSSSSTFAANMRWPNLLAKRLRDAGGHPIGVLNAGISGNRLLTDGAGESAEKRFERDVLSQANVRWVIFSDDPINDLSSHSDAETPSADLLIAAVKRLVSQAHNRGIRFYCSTLTPNEGRPAQDWSKAAEEARQRINKLYRSPESPCDGLVDQDAALREDATPNRYRSTFDSGDHLHPNDVGMQAIANAINLRLLTRAGASPSKAAGDIVARWNFHAASTGEVVEERSGKHARVTGTVYPMRGPVGDALQFDGYTGALHSEPLDALSHAENMAVASWLQLEAYPWNELPILDQQRAQQGTQRDQRNGFFFGLDAEGYLLARLGSNNPGISARSANAVPLRTWTLVTLTIDSERRLAFTIDGRPSPSQPVAEAASQALEQSGNASGSEGNAGDLLIGHVRQPLVPGPAAMIHPQLPIEYSIEGSLGGLTIYGRVLSSGEIKALSEQADKRLLAPAPWPKFPRGESDQKTFGAFYTTLHFDPLWDRSRRVGPDSDVVVRFNDAPIQLVFWQGNNYVPAWVTENDRWYTDEFMEIYGHPRCPDGEDCEPMSDKQVRYSHVRILESTPARAVVHWRYALSEVEKYGIGDASTPSDWGDWADEYWTVYPDGIAVRRSVLWSTAAERDKTEFQESIVLIPPGEMPEDSVNFDALTFANLAGASNTYRWQPKVGKGLALPRGPESFPEPKDAVIQWVNLKSEWKPFQVAWGENVKFAAYNGENSISSFEWWNHWPVAQIPSSGRPALAPDRAGHTSLSHIYWPAFDRDEQRVTKILLDGLTRSSASELAPIAASWRNPARLELSDGTVVPYDAAQRAYVLPASSAHTLRMTLHASAEGPAVHPAFVAPGWQGPAQMRVVSGADTSVKACIGLVEGIKESTLIVYLPITATGEVVLELHAE